MCKFLNETRVNLAWLIYNLTAVAKNSTTRLFIIMLISKIIKLANVETSQKQCYIRSTYMQLKRKLKSLTHSENSECIDKKLH